MTRKKGGNRNVAAFVRYQGKTRESCRSSRGQTQECCDLSNGGSEPKADTPVLVHGARYRLTASGGKH